MNKEIEEQIIKEASRCLNCKNKPCTKGCPLGNDIPQFIQYTKEKQYKKAYEILKNTTIMPFICGRVCPKSNQCQGSCIKGIKEEPVSIGKIESFIGDLAIENKWYVEDKKHENKKRIAIVGSGPAGINASFELAQNGYSVCLYEKHEKIGGILRYGIPEYRLDKKYVDILEEKLQNLGVKIHTNQELGKDFSLLDLQEKYDTIILDIGSNTSCKMNIPGEDLKNVFGANELLEENTHPNYENKKVIVIGGGNVALDAARTAKQKGAKEVTVVYRRAREQMPAETVEIEEAMSEDVKFLYQVNVKEIFVNKVKCTKNMLVKKENEPREVPVEIENSEFEMNSDYVIMAIGSKLNNKITEQGIELNEKGYIKADENGMTSIKNIYAIGDCAGNKASVAWASRSGKNVARWIIEQDKE